MHIRQFCSIAVLMIAFIPHRYSLNDGMTKVELAAAYHDQASDFLTSDELNDALPFLRTAVRLNPQSISYILDLGDAEMRLGLIDKARKRFERCLHLNPESREAATMLKKWKLDIGHDFDSSLNLTPSHRLHNVAEVTDLSVHQMENWANYLSGTSPIIIRNALRRWKWDLSIFDFKNIKHFGEMFGHAAVEMYPQNMVEIPSKFYSVNLSHALRFLSIPDAAYVSVDISNPGTVIQWNMKQSDWNDIIKHANATMPQVLADTISFNSSSLLSNCLPSRDLQHEFFSKTHWNMLIMAEAGGGMFNHKDVLRTGSWQAQVWGRKRWHFCSSLDDEAIGEPGKLNTMNPDYQRFPAFLNVSTCAEVDVAAGDLVIYPPDFWHQTLNLDSPSIALSGTIVLASRVDEFIAVVMRDCNSLKDGVAARQYGFGPELCSRFTSSPACSASALRRTLAPHLAQLEEKQSHEQAHGEL